MARKLQGRRGLCAPALAAAALVGCAGPGAPPAAAIVLVAPPPAPPRPAPAPAPRAAPPAPAPAAPPEGPGEARVQVPLGVRQPLELVGALLAPEPLAQAGWQRWTVVAPGPLERRRFELLLTPPDRSPLREGERVLGRADCRKGGWERACDLVLRDASRRLLVAVAGSGDPSLVQGLRVERGPVGVSYVRREAPLSVQHTHALVFRLERSEVTAMPLVWTRLDAASGRYWVLGYEVVWEGERPLDAAQGRAWALVRAR